MTSKLFLMEVERASSFLSSKRKEQIQGADRSDKIRITGELKKKKNTLFAGFLI